LERINRAHGTSTALTGSREIAAGVGPAHRNGEVATLKGGLAHDVSTLLGIGRHLGSQPRANTSHDHAAATARAWARQHTWRVVAISGCSCGSPAGGATLRSGAGFRDVLGAVGVGKEP